MPQPEQVTVAQSLARHSTITFSMDVYSHGLSPISLHLFLALLREQSLVRKILSIYRLLDHLGGSASRIFNFFCNAGGSAAGSL